MKNILLTSICGIVLATAIHPIDARAARASPSELLERGIYTEATKGDVENLDAFMNALRKVEVDAPRGKVKLDAFHNPVNSVYILKTERKSGALHNIPIATYPNVTQFWTWKPDEYMAMPSYVEMKGKWVK